MILAPSNVSSDSCICNLFKELDHGLGLFVGEINPQSSQNRKVIRKVFTYFPSNIVLRKKFVSTDDIKTSINSLLPLSV